jgi:trimeric autotransporter adhesin
MSVITPNQMDVNDDLAKAVAAATTPEALDALMKAEMTKQIAAATAAETQTAVDAKAAADAQAAKTAADAEAVKVAEAAKTAAAAPVLLTRTENIGGAEIEFTGATESEIDKLIINALKVAAALPHQTEQQIAAVDPQVAAAKAREAEEASAVARAELDLKFKRGEISASEFIEQSGAVKDYLEKQGIPLESLRASVEREQGKVYEQTWAEATTAFLATPFGATWPGGDRNQQLIGMKLIELGLSDATDKVAAIATAYKAMQDSKLIFPPDPKPETEKVVAANTTTTSATSAADAAVATATAQAAAAKAAADAAAKLNSPKQAPTSSAMFGASSGVGAGSEADKSKQEPVIAIPDNARPEEILEAWKAAQVKAGIHPNAAFESLYGQKK